MPVEPMPSGPVAFPRFHVAVASTREGLRLSLKRSKPPLGVVGGRLAMLACKSSAVDRGFAARNSCELWTRGCGTAWWGGPMVRRCLVAALVDSPL